MGGFPALAIQQPEGVLDQYGKAMQLKSLIGAQAAQAQSLEMGKLQLEEARRQQKESDTIRSLFQKNSGDLGKTIEDAAASGQVNPKTLMGLQEQHLKMQTDLATRDEKTLKNALDSGNLFAGALDTVKQVPLEQRAQMIKTQIGLLASKGIDVSKIAPVVQGLPDLSDETINGVEASLIGHNKAVEQEMKRREVKARQQQADKPSEVGLAVTATGEGPDAAHAEAALKRLDKSKREARPPAAPDQTNNAKLIADAIENGDQPPTMQGLYKNAFPVKAELARRGFPLVKATMDWEATKKYISTLNGSQQVRLRQAISTASDSLDKIEGLYDEWQKLAPVSGFKTLNKGALMAMKNLPGRAGAVATNLEAQIADVTSEIGNVYMGGNSPTDHSLALAGKNLSADWNKETFEEALKQAKLNLKIRQNSIIHSMPAGVSEGSNYMPSGGNAAPQSGGTIRARDPQRKLHEAPAGTKLPPGWKLE